jgi:predicted GH43/DUF377 family glycosyl hydrolase
MPTRTSPRARLSALVSAIAVVLAACGGAPLSDRPSAGASADVSAEPSAEAPLTSFTFGSEEPAVSREQTRLDESFINPGAVIEHDGTFHMFANLFTSFPGTSQVPHLTSEDGVTWRLAERRPVFTSEDIEFAQNGAHVSAGFVADDGTWVLIFETLSSLNPWFLGRATAPAPEGPWTVDPEPVLEPGPEGSIDAGGLSWPTVARLDDRYVLYYTAKADPQGDGVIAMATSEDGAAWTKADEPVLAAEAAWEDGSVDRPRVAVVPDGLAMVYSGRDLTHRGVAYSADGVTWERDGERPVITQDDFPVSGRSWDAALINVDGTLHYILEIGSGTTAGGTELYLATATLP